MDEKACRRGHSYVTFCADLDKRRLPYGTPGRKWGVLGKFRADLEAHGGSGDAVRELCMDMSAAYMKGARESFPDAEITFDRFHVVKLLNEAVEKVRRLEQKGRPELKRSRWLWLWNPERLTPDQRDRLEDLLDPSQVALDTAEAYPGSSWRSRSSGTFRPSWPGFTSNCGAYTPKRAASRRWPRSPGPSADTRPESSGGCTPGSPVAPAGSVLQPESIPNQTCV